MEFVYVYKITCENNIEVTWFFRNIWLLGLIGIKGWKLIAKNVVNNKRFWLIDRFDSKLIK